MVSRYDKFINALTILAVLTYLVVGLAVASGCLMVFFGVQFLGIIDMSIWVAALMWVAAGVHTCWLGIFEPITCEIERPQNLFQFIWWVALWPLIMVTQLMELLG